MSIKYLRICIYALALAATAPAVAVAYAEGYYEGYYQGYYQAAYTQTYSKDPIVVGRRSADYGEYFDGYVDEVRFSDTARWTGTSFTPPTSEYTNLDSNTVLLLHMVENRSNFYFSSAGGYFNQPPPAGYKALSTDNLPDPSVTQPSKYFTAKAYAGNAGKPSFDAANKGSNLVLTNNNFDVYSTSGATWANNLAYSTGSFTSGKWYAEFKVSNGDYQMYGIADAAKQQASHLGSDTTAVVYYPNANCVYVNSSCTGSFSDVVAGDVVMVAVDMGTGSNGKVWFGKNGTWYGSGNPSAGTGAQGTALTNTPKAFGVSLYRSNSGTIYANFGQPGRIGTVEYPDANGYFYYQPPSGFLALSPASSQFLSTGFKPDLVWIKNRVASNWHTVVDTARGSTFDLFTNDTSAQTEDDVNGTVYLPGSNGFVVGGNCSAPTNNVDALSNSYISWAWKKSAAAGVDVVQFSGNSAISQNIAHSLGTTPDFVFIKRLDATGDWYSWFSALGGGNFLKLNTTDASQVVLSPFAKDLIPVMTTDTTNGVTMSVSTPQGVQYAWKAGDKTGTYASSQAAANQYPNSGYPQWLMADLGTSQVVGAYTIATYEGNTLYAPVDFVFQGSANGSTWATLDTQVGTTWVGYPDKKTFRVTSPASYRYYRVYVTKTSGNEMIISELNLWQGTGITPTTFSVANSPVNNGNGFVDLATGGNPVSSTQYNGSYAPTKAFDRSPSTIWLTGSGSTMPQQLQYDLPTGKVVTSYSLLAFVNGDGGNLNTSAPKSWTFEGWNGSAWVVLNTQTNVAAWSSYEWRTYSVTNAVAYTKYRINLSANQGAWYGYTGINELALYGTTPASYIAYLFSNREGFQKSGTYRGNGTVDGPFVYTGFKPKFVMIKAVGSEGSADWLLYDSARNTYNPLSTRLWADGPWGESSHENYKLDFLSNGFKLRTGNANYGSNTSQTQYAYTAFADVPSKLGSTANNLSISNSLRFSASNNTYLTRTPTVAGNQKTWTFSAWVKRGQLDTMQAIMTDGASSCTGGLYFGSDNRLSSSISDGACGGGSGGLVSTAVYRDPSAWVHIVWAVDTTQATAANREHLYVNGVEVEYSTATYTSQNFASRFNTTVTHFIGFNQPAAPYAFDGNMAEVHFIDGSQYLPTSFGEFDSNGYWKPKSYDGLYGTNGYHLDFASTEATNFSTGDGTLLVGPLYKASDYTLMCTSVEGGSITTKATVNVADAGLRLTACNTGNISCSTPTAAAYVNSGDVAYLSWSAVGADTNSCNVTYSGGSVSPANSNTANNVVTTPITADRLYTLACTVKGTATTTTALISPSFSCLTTVGGNVGDTCDQCAFDTTTETPGNSGAVLSWCCPTTPSAGVNFSTSGFRYGSITVNPTNVTTYQLTCPSGDGILTLSPSSLGGPTSEIRMSPTRVRPGGVSAATWRISNLVPEVSCSITPALSTNSSWNGVGTVWEGIAVPTNPINARTLFTLRCASASGSKSSSAVVNLLPQFIER